MVLYVSQYYLRSWRSWIARQTPTLKAVGSNPAERTIKSLQIQLDLETFYFIFIYRNLFHSSFIWYT